MRKMLLGVLCLVGFVLVLASCDRSVPVIEPEAEGGTIGGVAMGLTPPTNMEMSWLWSSFNVATKATHTWDVSDHGKAHHLEWTPTGWTAGMIFVIDIPENALPSGITTITLSVPEGGISSNYPPVYEFSPDMEFLDDKSATVTMYYPPWLVPDPNGAYAKYCFYQVPPGSNNYTCTDFGEASSDGGPGGRRFVFTTTHFSRWASEPVDRL